jgi:exonuclease III
VKIMLILIALLVPLRAFPAELKIATWNLNWLTTRTAGDPELPSDVKPRSDDDFARLAQYTKQLNADVIAIEEIDGFSAASKVFARDQYSIHMTHDHVVQRVGIVVRRGLHTTSIPISPRSTPIICAAAPTSRCTSATPICESSPCI